MMPLIIAAHEQVLDDVSFGVATEQYAVRQNDSAFAGALERLDDVEQEGVVAVLGRRHAKLKAVELVVLRIESVAPGFDMRMVDWRQRSRRFLAYVGFFEMRAGERVALARYRQSDVRGGSCSSWPTPRWRCLLLAVDVMPSRGFVSAL